jgi:hypothetical protein
MQSVNLFPHLITSAARILGGEPELLRYLGCTNEQVQHWLNGDGEPPAPVYWRLSGLLARKSLFASTAARTTPSVRT